MLTNSLLSRIPIVSLATLLLLPLGSGPPRPAVAEEHGGTVSDEAINKAVATELVEDAVLGEYELSVDVNDGVVSLVGTTEDLRAARRAVRVASAVRGVTSVIDRIEVDAPPRVDDAIETDIADALLADPVTSAWEIRAEARDGRVTLTGVVETLYEKTFAERVAADVRGVTSIENRIAVENDEARPDPELLAAIQKRLRWDAMIDHRFVEVTVDDGVVTLDGTVGSLAERQQTIVRASITGVSEVNADDLVVESWAQDEELRDPQLAIERVDDASTREAVVDALFYDPRTTSFELEVTVDDGVAVLEGTVDNLRARQAAVADARNTRGVRRVENRIEVADQPADATELAAKVDAALARHPHVSAFEIRVSATPAGEVTLAGEVDTWFERGQAEDVAMGVSGVREITNILQVEQRGSFYSWDPFVDDWYIYDHSWYAVPEFMTDQTDEQILENIRDQFFWSPFVDADQVNVTVVDGVARLTGQVDSWEERRSAEENAREGGAIRVDNQLTVEPNEQAG